MKSTKDVNDEEDASRSLVGSSLIVLPSLLRPHPDFSSQTFHQYPFLPLPVLRPVPHCVLGSILASSEKTFYQITPELQQTFMFSCETWTLCSLLDD